MSDNRDMGISFGDLSEDLAAEEYPLTRDRLLEEYGDRELEHASGTTTVREVVGDEGQDVYESQDEVHQVILNMVGTEAVGRDRYSDRGGTTPTQNEQVDDEQDSV